MRAVRVPVFVLAAVLAYILCNAAWVTGESQRWLDAADRVSDAALRGDVSDAGTALDTLDALWQEHQGYLHIVISHTELDEAEALLAQAEAMAAQFPDTSLDTLEAVTARHRQIDAWNSTPVMEKAALERLETVMTEAGELQRSDWVDFEQLVDNSFAQKAMEAQ